MAMLSKGVVLKMGTFAESNPTLTAVDNLTNFPDLLGTIDTVEVTTLQNAMRVYIPGLADLGNSLDFEFIYDKTVFNSLNTIKEAGTRQSFELDLPDGVKISWAGHIGLTLNGKGPGEALTFTVQIVPDTDMAIDFSSAEQGPSGPTGTP